MKGQSAVIDLKKDADADTTPAAEARDGATAPLPPQSKSPEATTQVKAPPREPVSLSEKPHRLPETPDGRRRRSEKPRRGDGKILVVGREIVLKGEIKKCDRLVVEGQVEAIMKDCHEIEIAETGKFKGQVEFDRADVSGVFQGELTAREHLVVRATGRITGKVRFGELEIERGGQIIGDVQTFTDDAAAGKDAPNAVGKPAK
jgi:cytoskeletal protein CcmA (bactofilin family)